MLLTADGILVAGDLASFEHELEGTIEGTKCTWLALCSYEFGEGKIKSMRTVQDRLAILKQAAKGWLQETVVNSLVKRAEKGLPKRIRCSRCIQAPGASLSRANARGPDAPGIWLHPPGTKRCP